MLWEPTPRFAHSSELGAFSRWIEREFGVPAGSYGELWQWSVDDVDRFWRALWSYLRIDPSQSPKVALQCGTMPGARWFPGVRLNYAATALAHSELPGPALIGISESGERRDVGWADLANSVAALAAFLRRSGVLPGDRVAGVLPTVPEAAIALLATASIGAVWTCCGTELAAPAVAARLRVVDPKVLVTVDGYRYGGKPHPRAEVTRAILDAVPSIRTVVVLPLLPGAESLSRPHATWAEATRTGSSEAVPPVPLPFEHPLWIVYSSGTSGAPKAIVHSHGGVVLEHLKATRLHLNLRAGDRLFRTTSTGWIVWNIMVGALLNGTTVVCYDGDPNRPDELAAWRVVRELRVKHFGCGAAFIRTAMRNGCVFQRS